MTETQQILFQYSLRMVRIDYSSHGQVPRPRQPPSAPLRTEMVSTIITTMETRIPIEIIALMEITTCHPITVAQALNPVHLRHQFLIVSSPLRPVMRIPTGIVEPKILLSGVLFERVTLYFSKL